MMKTKQMAALAAIAALAAALGIGAQHWMQGGAKGRGEGPSAVVDGAKTPTNAGAVTDPVTALWNAPLTDPSGKPATLETGAVVRVPLFVPQGDKIKVDTRTGEYQGRVK